MTTPLPPSLSVLMRHGSTGEPADASSNFLVDEKRLEALWRHLQSSETAGKLLNTPYLSLSRHIELPMFGAENQPPPTFVKGMTWFDINRLMFLQRAANTAILALRQNDENASTLADLTTEAKKLIEVNQLRDPEPVLDLHRVRQFGAKKWLLDRDVHANLPPRPPGMSERAYQAKIRQKHKDEIEKTYMRVFDCYTNSGPLRAYVRAVKASGENLHDMFDGLGIAMQKALEALAALAAKVLPRRRPHEVRSDTPPLWEIKITEDGTIRACGLDLGINNVGLCILELAGMVMPPEGRQPLLGGAPHEPEPVWRVLCMELIDLDAPWDAKHGYAKYSFCPSTSAEWMMPDYTSARDIRNLLTPIPNAATAAPPPPAPKPAVKRKLKEIKIEGEEKEKRPKKRAKKNPADQFPPLDYYG